MSSRTQHRITLIRPSASMAWGFRLRGGQEFQEPLGIKIVFPNSPASFGGLQAGDNIESVGDRSVQGLTHAEATELIKTCGGANNQQLVMLVSRESSQISAPPIIPVDSRPSSSSVPSTVPPPPPPPPPPALLTNNNEISKKTYIDITGVPCRPQQPPRVEDLPGHANNRSVTPPVDNGYKVLPDDGIYVKVDGPTNRIKLEIVKCCICLDVVTGQYFTVGDKPICEKDYRCSACGLELAGKGCLMEEGSLYCKADFQKKFSPKCARCTQPIVDSVMTALGAKWHPNCFICSHCQQPIGTKAFHTRDSNELTARLSNTQPEAICALCFESHFAPQCFACKQSISDESKYFQLTGHNYHERCFHCAHCHHTLQATKIVKRGDRLFCCTEHANKVA